MKKTLIAVTAFLFFAVSAPGAYADLDHFMGDLNAQANLNMSGFNTKLCSQFNVPLPKVRSIMNAVASPADAFMCLQLSFMTKQPPERVMNVYKKNKGKGWGAIAKQLGIKPGSNEFHALKNGDFTFTGKQKGSTGKNQGKGKSNFGKGKGKKNVIPVG